MGGGARHASSAFSTRNSVFPAKTTPTCQISAKSIFPTRPRLRRGHPNCIELGKDCIKQNGKAKHCQKLGFKGGECPKTVECNKNKPTTCEACKNLGATCVKQVLRENHF